MEFREYRRYESVRAAFIPETTMLDLGNGPQEVAGGSYVVERADGTLGVVAGGAFESACVPLAEAPGVTLRGAIVDAKIKSHSDTGLPMLEVKFGFGSTGPDHMGGLIKAWHRQRSVVRVSVEPLFRQSDLFGPDGEAEKQSDGKVVGLKSRE